MNKKIQYTLLTIILLIAVGFIWLFTSNNYKRDGRFDISGNDHQIKVLRDEHGIAYVFAQNKADAIRGQGFVTAQDRLFQLEFYRALIKGELARLVGPSMLQSDIKMRVLDLEQKGIDSYSQLNEADQKFLAWYCEGFNEYLKVGQDEFPVELDLLAISPKPINTSELMAIIHFIGFNHGTNMEDEILSLNLAAHTQDASELLPRNENPDRTSPLRFKTDSLFLALSTRLHKDLPEEPNSLLRSPKFGSNNWAVAASKSASGKAILANDPHLDARLLPGIFYPIGLFCPTFKSVGLAIPGIPGLLIGRNEHLAFGVTNGYGDSQDLFIEQGDKEYYTQKGEKRAFKRRTETILVKDEAPVEIEIRSTIRGPIISDFDAFGLLTDDMLSLRWSQAESTSDALGITHFLEAKNVFEFRDALTAIDLMFFNFVSADVSGNIAHQATGLIPIRKNHLGAVPQVVSDTTGWDGFIPKTALPHMINPERAWVGTANHDTRPNHYPYYYSSHFSPKYRYMRMKELLASPNKLDADSSWDIVLDCKNKQAELLCPLFIKALASNTATSDLATILRNWNHEDTTEEVGAAVYHVLYNELASLILNDELPDVLEDKYWASGYYWTQRMDELILTSHSFIDNKETEKIESLDDLIVKAGIQTRDYLTARLGADFNAWTWGEIHKVKFVSPIRQDGWGVSLLGGEEYPKNGSTRTMNRGYYEKQKDPNFETTSFSTFRMVADLADPEKMRGILSGGSAARIFHPYYKSQLEAWKNEEWIPYWISEAKIAEHAAHQLILE